MSEIDPPLSVETDEAMPDEPASPWVMVITMLLLISGFMLTSAMLLHYAADRTDGEGPSFLSGISELIKNGKNWSAEYAARETPEKDREKASAGNSDSMVRKLFSGKDNGSVRWPKLKLTGFGRSADKEGAFAIINGKHVLVNTYIGDVKLVEIRDHGAVVEFRGAQKLLTVEQSR